jgi:hypothetical protein
MADNGFDPGFTGYFHDARVRTPRRSTQQQRGAEMMNAAKNHNTHHSDAAEQAVRWERCTLGALLTAPDLWTIAATMLQPEDFLLEQHQRIYRVIVKLHSQSAPADFCSVAAQVDSTVAVGYLSALLDGVVPANFRSYALHVRDAHRERKFRALHEQLAGATLEDRADLLQRMQQVLRERADQDWRSLFHTADEFKNAPPLRFAIEKILQEDGITMFGGLSCHGKTLVLLNITKALLDATPLFRYEAFAVTRPAERVLYLIPECSIGPFWTRLQLFRLQKYIDSGQLLVRTLSSAEDISLDDPRLLQAAKGADVFLDTAVRFMTGSDSDIEDCRPFATTLFRLLRAGARTVIGAHHSAKAFENAEYMSLQNILRGSGDIGALLSGCWGLRQIDKKD